MDALDPESGAPALGAIGGINAMGDADRPSLISQVVGGILERVKGILYLILPGGREVGRENKFYYDEATQRWCLPDGAISPEEEAQVQAALQTSSSGLRPGDVPSWGGISAHIAPVAPPPTGTAVTMARNPCVGAQAPGYDPLASIAHPVYAPSASVNYGLAGADAVDRRLPPRNSPGLPPPPVGTPPLAHGAVPSLQSAPSGVTAPLASPFGNNLTGAFAAGSSRAPLTSPFASSSLGAQQAPLSSPFGAQQAPLSSPFGAVAGVGSTGIVASRGAGAAVANISSFSGEPALGPPTIAEPLGSSPDAAYQQRAPPSPIMAPAFAEGALANPFGGGTPTNRGAPVSAQAFASLPEMSPLE